MSKKKALVVDKPEIIERAKALGADKSVTAAGIPAADRADWVKTPSGKKAGVLKVLIVEDDFVTRHLEQSLLKDMENIGKLFKGQSDSYIVKPVTKQKVERELTRLGLIQI